MSNHKKDPRHGRRVQVENPKHRMFGERGVVTKMDRGNVYVTMDGGPKANKGEVICTRWSCLTDLSPDPFNDPEYG